MGKQLLSGNEAISRGAYEAGVTVGVGYPGTPSTEILQALSQYASVRTEWAVNEKVALEVGLGASWAGARALVTMKHVGVNVAADPLFTSSYTGVKGGLVIVTADDPAMHSSQNEQDNRHYARAAKLPMLEPSDSREAKEFTRLAFELSEAYDTPVFLRTTTRLAHSLSIVETADRQRHEATGFDRARAKFVMIPGHARGRHPVVEQRMTRLAEAVNRMDINRIERGSRKMGVITSGIPYTYVKEAFPEASVLKLGVVNPIPREMIRAFCESLDTVYVVEELEPFLEEQIRAMGIDLIGKERFSLLYEYTPEMVKGAIVENGGGDRKDTTEDLPPRPPELCPGCPHANVFNILRDMGVIVSGDIGCYSLGVLPPFCAMDTLLDMGASIPVAQGMEMAMGTDYTKHLVSVIGDSTFAHSGVTGLINAAYNKHSGLIIVLDNATTAMTGMQPNPLSGETIDRNDTVMVDYRKLGEAVGLAPENIMIVDAYKPKAVEEAICGLLASGKLSLLVVQGLCVIERRRLKKSGKLERKQALRNGRLNRPQAPLTAQEA